VWEQIERRLSDLARRAGMAGVPPAAVAAVGVVLAVAVVGALWRWWPRGEPAGLSPGIARAEPGSAGTARASGGASSSASSGAGVAKGVSAAKGSGTVTVHVVGAVLRPGVYELPAATRVRDAVDAAGGMTGNAAQASINLARPLADGEQIVIPTQDEYAKATAGATTQNVSGASKGVVSPGGASAENPGAPSAGTIVNINTADAAALDALPGVGPSTAAKIVADREANGPFETPDDLGRVSGIGPKKLEQMKAFIRVR
jgi:competence protein ComEA